MAKLKSSKKVLIASLLVGVLVLGSVVSLILVLAAPQQNVKTNVKVSYVVDGVGASVSASYHIVNPTSGVVASSVNLSNNEEGESLDFSVSDLTTTKELNPSEETIMLTSITSMIVYEYAFTNNTVSPFMVSLIDEPNKEDINEVNNMTVSYRSTASRLSNFAGGFADSESKSQLVLNKDQTIYVYIAVEVSELNNSANYNGEIEWLISKVEEEAFSTLTLDTAGGDGGQTEIKYIAQAGVQLPHLTSLPTSSGTTEFMGYKNTAGKYVYDANGNSLISEIATENVTYTAEWIEAYQVSATGELTGLTAEAQTLTTLNIPESVTTINSGVFNNTTTSAKTINIPSSVTTIGESAFEGNTVIENIIIKEATETVAYAEEVGLQSIGTNAFKNCSNLKYLEISTTITAENIANACLMGCTSIETLKMPTYALRSGISTRYSGISLYFCELISNEWGDYYCNYVDAVGSLKEIIFSAGTTIPYCALYCSTPKLEKITFEKPDEITTIDGFAFFGCESLKSFTIPDSVTSISSYSSIFSECNSLAEMTLPAHLLTGGTYSMSGLQTTVFGGDSIPSSLKKVTITAGNMTYIEMYAFAGVTSITDVVIEEGITSVDINAFYNCSALKNITMAEAIYFGHSAFSNCNALEYFEIKNIQNDTLWYANIEYEGDGSEEFMMSATDFAYNAQKIKQWGHVYIWKA